MKTKIYLISMLACMCVVLYAQESQPYVSTLPGYQTAYKHSGAGENWFIQIAGGAQMLAADFDDMNSKTLTRITFMPAVSVGKLFNPYWGLRLKAQGGSLHGFENTGELMQHNKYYNVHIDAMWNWVNYWGVPEKKFNFGPYIGLGFAHKFQNEEALPVTSYPNGIPNQKQYNRYSNALSVNSGIQFGYALSKKVSLDFDLGASVLPDYFDRSVNKAGYEAVFAATGGFTFKLGKADFDAVEPMDYALIDNLNKQINDLKSENANLAKRPVSCPECPKVAPVVPVNEINYVPNVVFFRLNSYKIDKGQQINIYNTAEYLKSHPNATVKIVAYADRQTGNPKYNLALSEKRAKAVAKALTSEYGIPESRVSVEWKGDTEQPYAQNDWNRVAIFFAD